LRIVALQKKKKGDGVAAVTFSIALQNKLNKQLKPSKDVYLGPAWVGLQL